MRFNEILPRLIEGERFDDQYCDVWYYEDKKLYYNNAVSILLPLDYIMENYTFQPAEKTDKEKLEMIKKILDM